MKIYSLLLNTHKTHIASTLKVDREKTNFSDYTQIILYFTKNKKAVKILHEIPKLHRETTLKIKEVNKSI